MSVHTKTLTLKPGCWPLLYSSCIYLTSQIKGNVLWPILRHHHDFAWLLASEKCGTLCIAFELFLVPKTMFFSITIMLFAVFCVAFGFFPVSHYQSVGSKSRCLADSSQARQTWVAVNIVGPCTVSFYDLITTDVNFRKVSKRGCLQQGLVITVLASGRHPVSAK